MSNTPYKPSDEFVGDEVEVTVFDRTTGLKHTHKTVLLTESPPSVMIDGIVHQYSTVGDGAWIPVGRPKVAVSSEE